MAAWLDSWFRRRAAKALVERCSPIGDAIQVQSSPSAGFCIGRECGTAWISHRSLVCAHAPILSSPGGKSPSSSMAASGICARSTSSCRSRTSRTGSRNSHGTSPGIERLTRCSPTPAGTCFATGSTKIPPSSPRTSDAAFSLRDSPSATAIGWGPEASPSSSSRSGGCAHVSRRTCRRSGRAS